MAWSPPSRPDLEGGTFPPGPETYDNAVLRDHGRAMAEAATRRFYETWPALLERYGERGREHTLNDQYWHLSTMDTALGLGNLSLFLDYLAWLKGFLAAHGMDGEITRANFVWFREDLEALPPSAARDAAAALLDEALRVL